MSKFLLTKKQAQAIKILKGRAKHILLWGGARSGKTVIFLLALIYRACRHAESRYLIVRWRQAHAKTSVFLESLLPLLRKFAEVPYTINHSELMVRFNNGSEIWVGGLDDKERTEKLLGHEYSSIYFNECSQISYDSVILGRTRLAQKIEGLRNKAYYDCNPPSPLHWAHRLFIEQIDPKTLVPLEDPKIYDNLQMNPDDNVINLPEDYLDELKRLPDHSRRRFLRGEWVRAEGLVLYNFSDRMIVSPRELPRPSKIERFITGNDFGRNMASILIGWQGDRAWLYDEIAEYNFTSSMLNKEITRRWGRHIEISYCDPSGGERIQEIYMGTEADNSVEPGLNCINTLMEEDNFRVCSRCTTWLQEVESYRRDEKGRIIKENDHMIDASRYAIFSERAGGIMIYA